MLPGIPFVNGFAKLPHVFLKSTDKLILLHDIIPNLKNTEGAYLLKRSILFISDQTSRAVGAYYCQVTENWILEDVSNRQGKTVLVCDANEPYCAD